MVDVIDVELNSLQDSKFYDHDLINELSRRCPERKQASLNAQTEWTRSRMRAQ